MFSGIISNEGFFQIIRYETPFRPESDFYFIVPLLHSPSDIKFFFMRSVDKFNYFVTQIYLIDL